MNEQQWELATALLEVLTAAAATLPVALPESELFPEVSESQLAALQYLSVSGTSEMHLLAAGVGVTAPTMTSTIKLLVKKGLVERQHAQEDWRKVLITLSPRGVAAYAEYSELRVRALAVALDQLSAEQRAMLLVSVPALRALARQVGQK